jgi:GntR family transcriptional regulator
MSRPYAEPTREPANELAEKLRTMINAGELQPGVQLPTARDLSENYEVALATAVRAVATLREEGLITTTRGRGSYVATRHEVTRGDTSRYRNPDATGLSPNRSESATEGYRDEVDTSDRWTNDATPELAERLGIETGAAVSAVRYRWIVGGVPTQISTQWEPLGITAGTSAEIPSSKTRNEPAIHARFSAIGWTGTRVVEEYRARMPTREEARMLEITSRTPVLSIKRFTYAMDDTRNERVIETADIVARADRMVIRSESEVNWPAPRV